MIKSPWGTEKTMIAAPTGGQKKEGVYLGMGKRGENLRRFEVCRY